MAGWIEFYKWKYFGRAEQIDPNPIYERAKEIDGLGGGDGTTLEAGLQAAQDLELIHKVDAGYVREVYDIAEVQQALHRYDVVLSAFLIAEGWMNATSDGWIEPGGRLFGGHAVLLTGYSLNVTQPFYQLQNSWGEENGWRGFNRMPPEMFAEQFQYGLVWDV